MNSKRQQTGIRTRHARGCPATTGGQCRCQPRYEASAWDSRRRQKIRKSFPRLSEARQWRADAIRGLRLGTLRAPTATTLREAAEVWLAGIRDGLIRNRSGDQYKPSVIRSYASALKLRILPDLGAIKLSAIERRDVQALADRMLAKGADPSTIQNTLMPLRVIFRRAVEDGHITVNPCANLRLPAVRGKRDRIASPEEASRLLATLPKADRAVWATAMYAGLRRGELMALRWVDVDLAKGVIRVERAWDVKVGVIEPKSHAGTRTVPIASVLRDHLLDRKLRTGGEGGEGLVFGRTREVPFDSRALSRRAETAWKRAKMRDGEEAERTGRKPEPLEPIGLHECRHTFASLMIAAGVNAKALSTYLGHSSITITLDRYGHLMPGNEDEAAALLDAYLERANTQARLAQVG